MKFSIKKLALSGAVFFQALTAQSVDFSKSTWTPLTKSVAQLNSSLITSQSLINTVSQVTNYVYGAAFTAGALYALSKKSPTAFVGISGLLGAMAYATVPLLKKIYAQKINNNYTTVLKQLNDTTVNDFTAAQVCAQGRQLLNSPDLCPPYTARSPEGDYQAMLQTIESKFGSSHTVKTVESHAEADFIKSQKFQKIDTKLPIVFHPDYDISFGGLEKLHPFDTKKYSKIARAIGSYFGIEQNKLYKPEPISEQDMLLVHSKQYIDSLTSTQLGLIADMPPLALLPTSLAHKILMNPVRLATGGTVLGAQLALDYGWAINLSGGYHHAKSNEPVYGGFCIINDICIAAKKILAQHPDYKILIVDLDAHQGNGHEQIAKNISNIAIFDMYNGDTWPGDFDCQERINFNYPLKSKTSDAEYINVLKRELPKAINQVQPDFILYVAGSDIYEKDTIGVLSITKQSVIERDEIVFSQAINRNIPILMTLSGGYHKDSHAIISDSIINLNNKLLKIK